MTDLEHLLCKVNKVTAYHRHGQKIPESALDDLANTQVEIEEHTQQYNSEAIKTIREALKKLSALKGSWDGERYSLEESDVWSLSRPALAALDSLTVKAVEPYKYQSPPEQGTAHLTLRYDSGSEYEYDFVVNSWNPLAVEPSVDALEFMQRLWNSLDDESIALITARDERIRWGSRATSNLVSAIKEAIEKIRTGDEETVDWSCARDERIRQEYERLNRNLVSAIKEALDKIRIGDEIKSDWSYVHDAVTRLKTALKWNDSDTLVLKGGKKE